MKILDNIPLHTLLVMTVFLGLAPFFPPHLFEKFGMLLSGTLTKPIDMLDMLDVLFHLSPAFVLILKIRRMRQLAQDE